MGRSKVIVEVRLSASSRYRKQEVSEVVSAFLTSRTVFRHGPDDDLLAELAPRFDVDRVFVALPTGEEEVPYYRADLRVAVYRLSFERAVENQTQDQEDGSVATLFTHRKLPCADFEEVWESLILESDTKQRLLRYTESSLLFSDRKVDPKILACNRVVLLHGPPGTGKTSLCQGLAQKTAIYQRSRYSGGVHVLEVNAQALFSRWFSESGKLVTKLFELVRSLANDPDALVFVMIDEIESLTGARSSNKSNSDPSDALRVVNSMLTQIDKLRYLPNVMLLATSNLTDHIDDAFLDRADLKLYVGPPGPLARRQVLASCLEALMDAGIVHPREVLQSHLGLRAASKEGSSFVEEDTTDYWLTKTAQITQGWSGRALRKLPLKTHAFCIGEHQVSPVSMARAMYCCVLELDSSPESAAEQ